MSNFSCTNSYLNCIFIPATSIFNDLPENGKFLEITKRIAIAVVSPFIYLASCFVDLMNLSYSSIKNKVGINSTGPDETPINISKQIEELQRTLTSNIQQVIKAEKIDSLKFLFTVNLNNKLYQQNFIFNDDPSVPNQNLSLPKIIENLTNILKETFEKETSEDFSNTPTQNSRSIKITWAVFIKEKNQSFAVTKGTFAADSCHQYYNGYAKNMSREAAEEHFKIALTQLKQNPTSQLDEANNFI